MLYEDCGILLLFRLLLYKKQVFFAAADSPQTLIETCAVSGRSGTLVSSLLL
jgi:hypothetical protein